MPQKIASLNLIILKKTARSKCSYLLQMKIRKKLADIIRKHIGTTGK